MKYGLKIVVEGLVQGVGFRPFVYNLACKYDLSGVVTNTGSGVVIEIEGLSDAMKLFCVELESHPPPLAHIDHLSMDEQPLKNYDEFKILKSHHIAKTTSISPDIAVCHACLSEMNDPKNRRFGYYLINCTNCGPRYSIIHTLPYDRENTSMKHFEMCLECKSEYDDPMNRRYHAQPISCHKCGPVLIMADKENNTIDQGDGVIEKAAKALKNGSILAIKGIGGFHLMCDATDEQAVERLRSRKNRPKKPFAVMFPHIDSLLQFLSPDTHESELLTSIERPIVLIKKAHHSRLAKNIAPDIDTIGAMIAYTPLHILLFDHFSFPLVATSANRSDEPIIRTGEELKERLGDVIDYIIDFDREIVNTADDSIVQVIQHREMRLRLGRGYTPLTFTHHTSASSKILAVGGHQKNTIGLAFGDKMILSPHIGDLNGIESTEYFERSIETFKKFYDFEPDIIVCDKHPSYATAQWAKSQGIPVVEVQHHYAHALACMAEFALDERVLAFCFDGTGYGDDGTIWGGEILLADPLHYERIGHTKPFSLLGGEKAIKEPKRVALGLLFDVYSYDEITRLDLPLLEWFKKDELILYYKNWKNRINAPSCSSIGRIFDAVASFCDIVHENVYEGEAGRRLEELYSPDIDEVFDYTVDNGVIDFSVMIRVIVVLAQSEAYTRIATGFINTLVTIIEEFAKRYQEFPIVLCGGVFQNKTLLSLCVRRLEEKGHKVYFQVQTPINDGSIALGQIYHALHLNAISEG